eukprot:GHRQ01035962.1.p1 GENE.GHRQ01035962.1~~GHRQ01035962.1.p1  ORF type:complete len:228 (-),score=44.11 GHRQ01035962.1:72-755(-)
MSCMHCLPPGLSRLSMLPPSLSFQPHASLPCQFCRTCRIAANDKVPAFIDRSFHPQQRQPGQLRQQSLAQQVTGRQQFKYFRRPPLPYGAPLSAPLHLTQQQQPVPEPPGLPEPAIKDAYTQSDYRESEAQTLPWSPDWVLPSNPAVLAKQAALSAKFNCQGPEVLQVANLMFGDGLPGEHDMQLVAAAAAATCAGQVSKTRPPARQVRHAHLQGPFGCGLPSTRYH